MLYDQNYKTRLAEQVSLQCSQGGPSFYKDGPIVGSRALIYESREGENAWQVTHCSTSASSMW